MKTMYIKFLLIISLLFNTNVFSMDANTYRFGDKGKQTTSANQSINSCPLGVVFNIYSANYEYLFAGKHGFVARIDFESHTEKYAQDKVGADGIGYTLNYRYHFSGNLESLFVGSYVRYRFYDGDGNSDGEKFSFEMPEYTFGLNAGKRWVWNNGFNMTFSLGYGISTSETKIKGGNAATNKLINKFEDDYTFLSPFLGEFSIGYAF